jgi:predicted GNAT superfamily acetyltransferase
MMAVQANAQDRGIGRLLKSAQRSRLLDAGVEVAKWTFDPLVARNAYLNLVRLGASVVNYVPDMYGDDPMSTTDSVIGSDRLLVEWDLRSEPPAVPRRAASVLPAPLLTLSTDVSRPEGLPETPIVHVAIPSDIQEVKTADAELAKRWRSLTRHVFMHYASRGYEVRAFTRHTHDGGWYHLEQIERAGA